MRYLWHSPCKASAHECHTLAHAPLASTPVGRSAAPQLLCAYHARVSALCRRFRQAFRDLPRAPGSGAGPHLSQLFLGQEKQVAWPSVVQTVCALRFFYRVTLGRPVMLEYIVPPRRPFTLPTILSQAEGAAVLTVSRHLKHRAILTTLYAAGLRVSALCQLQVTDIDSARMVLRVRQGKGQQDRYVMLSPKLLPFLRQYWQQDKPRPWLFPGHPRTRPMTTKAVSLICRHAGQAAHLSKAIHPPVLRHAFATHLEAIRKQLLAKE